MIATRSRIKWDREEWSEFIKAIIEKGEDNKCSWSTKEVGDLLGVSEPTVRRRRDMLIKGGVIVVLGNNKRGIQYGLGKIPFTAWWFQSNEGSKTVDLRISDKNKIIDKEDRDEEDNLLREMLEDKIEFHQMKINSYNKALKALDS